MAKELLGKFEQLNRLYEVMIPKAETVFQYLKQDNHDMIEELNEELVFLSVDLKKVSEELTLTIKEKCKEKGIEEKIPLLIDFYTIEEKEQVMAALKTAIHYERKFNNKISMYRLLAEAKKETSETVVELWRHIAQEESSSGSMFVNKKL